MSTQTVITDGNLSATVESKGAQLLSLKLGDAEYLWQRDERWWPRTSPVLFPIVGNLRNDEATSAQGHVKLGRHGLARNYEHELVSADEKSVTYRLDSNDQTREVFPFDFRLEMTYALNGGKLAQTFKVINTGSVDLPFTFGGHPAFNVPAPGTEGESFEDYRLEFAEPWTYATPRIGLEDGLTDFDDRIPLLEDSATLPLTHELFDVDTLTFENVPQSTVRMVGPAGHGVQVDFDGFRFLGVWSAKNSAPFVAIEPWVGCATTRDESDVFEEKRGTITLKPGEEVAKTFTMMPF